MIRHWMFFSIFFDTSIISDRSDCCLTRTHYPDSTPTNLCSFCQYCVIRKYQYNLKVVGLTGPGRDTTIYRIRGDAANHYTIDAVEEIRKRTIILYCSYKISMTIRIIKIVIQQTGSPLDPPILKVAVKVYTSRWYHSHSIQCFGTDIMVY